MIRRILRALCGWHPDPGMPWPEGIKPINTRADWYVQGHESLRTVKLMRQRGQMRGAFQPKRKDDAVHD